MNCSTVQNGKVTKLSSCSCLLSQDYDPLNCEWLAPEWTCWWFKVLDAAILFLLKICLLRTAFCFEKQHNCFSSTERKNTLSIILCSLGCTKRSHIRILPCLFQTWGQPHLVPFSETESFVYITRITSLGLFTWKLVDIFKMEPTSRLMPLMVKAINIYVHTIFIEHF